MRETAGDLLGLADALIGSARGSEQMEVVISRATSTTVKVHGGEVESLTSADSSGAGIRVISEGRLGFAHCGSLDRRVLEDTLAEARDNCRFGEPDEFNSLVEPDGSAVVRRDAWSEGVIDTPVRTKVESALDLERRVLAIDGRVRSVRSTAYGDAWGESVIVSTSGIRYSDRGASCWASTQPLAVQGDETQIGVGHDASRDPASLDLDKVAAEAVERSTRLLGAVKPQSARLPILLEPRLSLTLLGIVSGMLCGDAVVKGRSPFADRAGETIASPLVHLTDDPTRAESLGSEEVDGEGLACRRNELIVGGVLSGFLRDGYVGRRMGLGSTASAVRGARSLPGVGAQVLVMGQGHRSLEEMTSGIDNGILINSFSGLHSGVNPISGDFSVGADGLMIRAGQLAEPVRELTVASTIQRLLLDVAEVGGDLEWLPSGHAAASMLISDVSVSGA